MIAPQPRLYHICMSTGSVILYEYLFLFVDLFVLVVLFLFLLLPRNKSDDGVSLGRWCRRQRSHRDLFIVRLMK